MIRFAGAALVVGASIALGCSSGSTTHHVIAKNTLTLDVEVTFGLSTDDTITWQAFETQLADLGGAYGGAVSAGQTASYKLPAPGHYRWAYSLYATDPSAKGGLRFVQGPDAVFDVVDGNSDIHLTTTTGASPENDGGVSTPSDGGGNTGGNCLPSGSPCSDSNDNCCTVCGLNQAGICT